MSAKKNSVAVKKKAKNPTPFLNNNAFGNRTTYEEWSKDTDAENVKLSKESLKLLGGNKSDFKSSLVKRAYEQTEKLEIEKRLNANLTTEEQLLFGNEKISKELKDSYEHCSFKKKGNKLGCIQTNCVDACNIPSFDLAMKLIQECRGILSTKSNDEYDKFFFEVV